MERIGTAVQPWNAPNAAIVPSPTLEKRLDEISELMAQTRSNYPSQEIPPGTAELWMALWLKLAMEHGTDRLRGVLLRHFETSKFLPSPADITEGLDAMKREEKKAEIAKRGPFVPCGKCINGVVLVNAKGEPWKFSIDGHEKFSRECECKRSWRAA